MPMKATVKLVLDKTTSQFYSTQLPVLSTVFEFVMNSVVRADTETVPENAVECWVSGCPGTLYANGVKVTPSHSDQIVIVNYGLTIYIPVSF